MFKPINPKDFLGFIYACFQDTLTLAVPPFHQELCQLTTHQQVAVAAPRGFAKSTFFSFFYPLYLALTRPNSNIMLVSASMSSVREWINKIKWEIEGNPMILNLFGNQQGNGTWTQEELRLANGSRLFGKGRGGQIRGKRPDFIVCDDLEDDELVANPERLEEFTSWFLTTLLGTRHPSTQVIVVGTILDPESFLADWIENPRKGWSSKLYAALDENGNSIWPDRYTIEVLDNWRQELGEYGFAQEFMNDPIPSDRRTFQRQWFTYYDELPRNLRYFITIDPAISLKKTADYTGFVVCGIDSDRTIYVVEAKRAKLLPSEIINQIFLYNQRFADAIFGIEVEGFQKQLYYSFKEECKKRKRYPKLIELKSGGIKKTLRIEALQPFYECGKIVHARKLPELETELLRFPSVRCHDDLIDALAYQLDIIKKANVKPTVLAPNTVAALEREIELEHSRGTGWGNKNIQRFVPHG